jgi:hypothetical protein
VVVLALANLGSDRYHPGSLVLVLVRGSKHTWLGIQRRKRRAGPGPGADTGKRAARSGRPLVLLYMVVKSLSSSVSCAGVNSWVDLYNDHGSAGSGWCVGAEESRSAGQLKLQQGSQAGFCSDCHCSSRFAVSSVDEVWLRVLL